MIGKLLARLDEKHADRKIERHNKKLTKLLNKRLCIYQTTIWAFVRGEWAFDNCETLKHVIRMTEDNYRR